MALIRIPAQWISDITRNFPLPIQPGLYAAICLLILWLVIRRSRPIWNALIRSGCIAADLTIGFVLLPEYMWTRARRARGKTPGMLAVTASPVAERALDRAAGAYERHRRVKITGRPPLVWAALLCLVSLGLHWLMLRPGGHGPPEFASRVWSYWSSFSHWAKHG